jgi:hypothetical protein
VPVRAGAATAAALGALLAVAAPAWAQDADDDDEEEGEDEETVIVDEGKPKPKAKQEFKKQDLRGHAVDAGTATNVFEKDRFFVDKVDTKKSVKGTLIQGSLASSSFAYTESSGALPGNPMFGSAGAKFSRLFTDMRLQTDFRHIGGGKWDARIDTRARFVTDPDATSTHSVTPTRIQSGFNGQNEYEVREAWIVRSGKRSDLFLGRQFITDLGALRIDGLRIDYAKSEKLTLITFGGLYPIRGSRSITTDYKLLRDDNGAPAGRFVGAGGFGGAYRTLSTHGALGAVVLAPLSAETPRVYATSNGYYRSGAKVDLYHMAIVDLFGKAAPALTNLSAGVNLKPSQRLRVTASFNRVDTETLNVQANAFLSDNAPISGSRVQNETFINRLSTNAGKVGVSAALGPAQRFEVSTAVNYRYRPQFTLVPADGMTTATTFPAAKGVDVFLGLVDRQSFAKLRLGADVSRSFAAGNVAFNRSEVLAARVFASRELKSGRGEWEAEAGYSTTKDVAGGVMCPTLDQCFGSSTGSIVSVGGSFYYRVNRDWFALANLFVNRQAVSPTQPASLMGVSDPAILSLTGFARIAYRF